jgi:methyl-accepting chemotaxis protein
VDARQISQEQALATFREDMHRVRFGAADDYLLLQTLDGTVVMHGGDANREGKPTASRDASGRSTADLARDVLAPPRAALSSIWRSSPEPRNRRRRYTKVYYVAKFEPWQLVFLVGTWIDDVDVSLRSTLVRLGTVGGAILVVTLLAAWLINRDITISLHGLEAAMGRLAKGDLRPRCLEPIGAMKSAKWPPRFWRSRTV